MYNNSFEYPVYNVRNTTTKNTTDTLNYCSCFYKRFASRFRKTYIAHLLKKTSIKSASFTLNPFHFI